MRISVKFDEEDCRMIVAVLREAMAAATGGPTAVDATIPDRPG